MFQNILVPLDGSAFSEYALPFAIALARRSGGTLQLTHVRGAGPAGEALWELDPTPGGTRARLHRLAHRMSAESGVPASALVLEGDVVEELERHAASTADVVVMATHGRTGPSRAWLGSVAEALVRRVGAPLLLVRPPDQAPAPVHEPCFRHVLVPLDGSPFAEQVLPLAMGLLTLEGTGRLLLLRSVSDEDAASKFIGPADYAVRAERDEAERYLVLIGERLGVPAERRILVGGSPARSILQTAADDEVDVVVMATHGRSGLQRLLLGSVADKVLRGTHRPILLLRPSEPDVRPVPSERVDAAPIPAF